MAGEKRTKPCGNCKKSKTKCEYRDSLPCNRCLSLGQAATCRFVVKLPSIGLPPVNTSPVQAIYNPAPSAVPLAHAPLKTMYPPNPLSQVREALPFHTPRQEETAPAKLDWKAAMEDKLTSMDAKFNDLLMVLKSNQKALIDERELTRKYISHNQALHETLHQLESNNRQAFVSSFDGAKRNHSAPSLSNPAQKRASSENLSAPREKSMRIDNDFRGTVLSLREAKLLFNFFDTNISQQLFGFEIKQFSVEAIWKSSPLLICAVCTIASMHYPDARISRKQDVLHRHLHELCSGLLFNSKPRTEQEGFNTIVALVLCSFWLSDSQMFTGLALQLANDFRITHPRNQSQPKGDNSLSDKDRLKLWYLLYILDGQQSMTFNRQALVSSEDYNVLNSKKVLLEANSNSGEAPAEEVVTPTALTPEKAGPSFTDLRLISQVEYNAALNESLKGNAWELIAPAKYGIPSRSNLELDKWMVSWTVLLAPSNNGSVWLSKSTLIYYNFAKMYINSTAIRKFQGGSDGNSILLPTWKNCQVVDHPTSVMPKPAVDSERDSDDSDEEDEVGHQLQKPGQELSSVNIAVNAAQTVLNLVLNDADILNNLKYVPVHIHIMLYYAAILLVSLPLDSTNGQSQAKEIIGKLKTVKLLLRIITGNLPTDRTFGHRLLDNLDQLFDERAAKLKSEISDADLDSLKQTNLLQEIADVEHAYTALEPLKSLEYSSREVSPKPDKIYAWPGSHHGHP